MLSGTDRKRIRAEARLACEPDAGFSFGGVPERLEGPGCKQSVWESGTGCAGTRGSVRAEAQAQRTEGSGSRRVGGKGRAAVTGSSTMPRSSSVWGPYPNYDDIARFEY